MTTTWNMFLTTARPEANPDLLAQGSARRAAYGVAVCLAAAMVLAALVANPSAGGSTPRGYAHHVAVAPSAITDSPPPAYVLRLELDRFR